MMMQKEDKHESLWIIIQKYTEILIIFLFSCNLSLFVIISLVSNSSYEPNWKIYLFWGREFSGSQIKWWIQNFQSFKVNLCTKWNETFLFELRKVLRHYWYKILKIFFFVKYYFIMFVVLHKTKTNTEFFMSCFGKKKAKWRRDFSFFCNKTRSPFQPFRCSFPVYLTKIFNKTFSSNLYSNTHGR